MDNLGRRAFLILAVMMSPLGLLRGAAQRTEAGATPAGPVSLNDWLGTALRLVPDDFRLRSRFGVGVDWPISYEDLEPWYCEAERELGVGGDPAADPDAPRSQPYPLLPIPMSYLDQRVAAALAGSGYAVQPTPQGTYRMGSAPRQSVVNSDLRAHDHPNVYLLGSGVFPTSGASNPTLTIAALALRAVGSIGLVVRG